MGNYIDVITELALDNALTYALSDSQSVQVGARVIVTVSRRRYIGVVGALHQNKPSYRTLEVSEIIDTDETFVSQSDIDLWQWVARYYMCSIGTVYRAAMPHSFRTNTFTYSTEKQIQLATSDDLSEVVESLKGTPGQRQTLLKFMEIAEQHEVVPRAELLKTRTAISLNELVKKGILTVVQHNTAMKPLTKYNAESTPEYEAIHAKFESNQTLLLHEIEPIDKFRLFIKLIEENTAQTLLLMPDSFTAEAMYERLNDYFGGGIAAYYPTLSDSRRSVAYAQSRHEASVIVGARGAVLLPMQQLGLVIIEAEHDYNYKNSDSSPRLNARDVALVKAVRTGAKVLLCSETPSVESYYNATRGAWGLVTTVQTEKREVGFKVLERGKELLSIYLRRRVDETLKEGKQALIFQNRRGFSQWVECGNCFEIPTCHHCNVSLTYHKTDSTLRCHYCGFHQPFTEHCTECGSATMTFQGRGTERIEESLSHLFPDARIQRIDYDSTRGKGSFEQIAAAIATDCDIIVGTQMVMRGVDFSRVSLVGIVNADNMLSQSDFRTSERAFSLLTTLSNRIRSGEVIIQTTKRLDNVIKSVEQHNPVEFYEKEITLRTQMNYPPAVRMINFRLSHKSRQQLFAAATRFESLLRPTFGSRISPPFEPSIDRQSDYFIIEFYLRIERERSVVAAKEIVRTAIASMRQAVPSLIIAADVDPA